MSTPDMAAYLLERITEDERIARAACARDDVAEHWQWVGAATDQMVPDGGLKEAVAAQALCLRSVETHPVRFTIRPLSTFALWRVNEYTAALPHIARHDPGRVIAECEAKRRVTRHCLEVLALGDGGGIDLAEEVLQHLVQVYADRSDFPPEWLPEVPW